ncbi:MAG: hypothetical protein LBC94_08640 [Desulfovibrio sp.]|jgi:hypothetical protein|nr:hypothetical protein [Desulfovibrio sp.]
MSNAAWFFRHSLWERSQNHIFGRSEPHARVIGVYESGYGVIFAQAALETEEIDRDE